MIIILTFFGVMAVSIVLFGFWVVSTIFKLILGLAKGGGRQGISNTAGRQCRNGGCRTVNPLHACFCRRCGSNLTESVARRPPMQQPRYDAHSGRGRRQVASI